MKKISFMLFVIIFCFIIQTSIFSFLNFFNVIPNFSLIALVIFAVMSDGFTGGILGFLTGLLYDAMIYDVFGIFTLIYFFIGAIIGTLGKDMIRENYIVYSAITGISTVVLHFLLYLILFFLKFDVGFAAGKLSYLLIETLINSVLVVFFLKIILYLFDKLNIKI